MDVLVLLSGGIDSATCVGYYTAKDYSVSALFVDYGQRQSPEERIAAQKVASYYGIGLHCVSIDTATVPNGYVPGRNALLLTLALMNGSFQSGLVAIGIHDGTPYADCSADFVTGMQRIFDMYSDGQVQIDAPFMTWTKSDIWDYAMAKNVPLELTWSNNLSDLYPVSRSLYKPL